MTDPRGIDVIKAILEHTGCDPVVDFEAMEWQRYVEYECAVGTGWMSQYFEPLEQSA